MPTLDDMIPVPLEMVAGLPYAIRFRVTGVTAIWPTLDLLEVRGQVRKKDDPASPLVGNLTPYLVATIDGTDILVTLRLNGAQTRTMAKGYYDIVISDVGPDDDRALPVSKGPLVLDTLVTSGAGDV